MSILSLDLSTKSTGWSVYNNDNQLERYGCITASHKDPLVRLKKIINELDEIIQEEANLEYCIVEEVQPSEDDKKSLHTYKILMYMQAILVLLLHEKYPKVKIEFLYPNEWRKLCHIQTGRGIKRETLKQSDIAFVEKQFNINNINDDIADAIGIGYAYIQKNDVIEW